MGGAKGTEHVRAGVSISAAYRRVNQRFFILLQLSEQRCLYHVPTTLVPPFTVTKVPWLDLKTPLQRRSLVKTHLAHSDRSPVGTPGQEKHPRSAPHYGRASAPEWKTLTRPRYFTPTRAVLTACFLETVLQGYGKVIVHGKGESPESQWFVIMCTLIASRLASTLPDVAKMALVESETKLQ